MVSVIIGVVSGILSVGISYGINSQKIKQLELQMSEFKKDHDLLVALNTKIDLLLKQKKI